jgi:hypothetical protein
MKYGVRMTGREASYYICLRFISTLYELGIDRDSLVYISTSDVTEVHARLQSKIKV